MSLFDFIFEQEIILIAVLFAMVPLLAALTLFVVSRIRRVLQKRARKAREQSEVQEEEASIVLAQVGQEELWQDQEDHQRVKQTRPAQAKKRDGDTSQEANPEAEEIQEEEEDVVSSAMQDLLSSVFDDDGAAARYEVLLRGLDEVDIAHLAALTSEVANQLRTRSTPTA